jgi:hypothetical protein
MAITETQKNNIHKLSIDDCIEVLYECIERLGVVSQDDYKNITGYKYSRQNLVLDMKSGKVRFIKLGRIRFPIINNN